MKIIIYFFFTLLMSNTAIAASNVLIWPIYHIIDSDKNGSILWLENRGDREINLQIRILKWDQQNNQDTYQEQHDVVASPPFMHISAEGKQLVRLLKQVKAPTEKELSYRIIIDEIPNNNDENQQNLGLNIKMRYVLPLFLKGHGIDKALNENKSHHSPSSIEPILHWEIETKENKKYLKLHNSGVVHARISNAFFGHTNDINKASNIITNGLLGYVLPDRTMYWPLEDKISISKNTALFIQLGEQNQIIKVEPN